MEARLWHSARLRVEMRVFVARLETEQIRLAFPRS
jgi:hypothetical protein